MKPRFAGTCGRECVYCAVNKDGEIQWVQGSSNKTRYFRTDRYLKREIEYHNEYHKDDLWHLQKFALVEVNCMTIKLQLGATYDGMSAAESAQCALQLRDAGMPDEMINEMLEEHKDKEPGHEERSDKQTRPD